MKIETIYTMQQPLSHIGESESTVSFLNTIRIAVNGKVEEVFALTGNSIRGTLRDCAARHLLDKLNARVGKKEFNILFSGGNISGSMSTDIDQAKKYRDLLPIISLFGAGSCGFYRQYEHRIEHWNKRPDFTSGKNGKYLEAKGKIDTAAGVLKAYHFPQIIRTVSDIEFYGVGTIEKIRDLLSYIPAVGKKPAAGWGMVKEWIVEPFSEDWSTIGKYGLMRPMPVNEYSPERQDYKIMQSAILPPYWKSQNVALCYIPNVIINDNDNKESGITTA